jgi:hypothetical protein
LVILALLSGSRVLLAEGDPQGEKNLAAQSTLPSGPGLASHFPADHGISRDPDVIFARRYIGPSVAP